MSGQFCFPCLLAPLLKKKLTSWQLLGCLLGYIGVTVIATQGTFNDFGDISLKGIGLILIAAVFWCLYWIINAGNQEDPIVSLLCCTLCGLPLLLAINLIHGDWPTLTATAIAGAIYVGVFEMGLTSMLWLKALKTATNTSQISSLMFLSPVFAMVLIGTVLGENDSSISDTGNGIYLIGYGCSAVG